MIQAFQFLISLGIIIINEQQIYRKIGGACKLFCWFCRINNQI